MGAQDVRSFDSLTAFRKHISTLRPLILAAEAKAVQEGARLIQAKAKSFIGSYQTAHGPFAAWAPLSDSTMNGFDLNGRHIPGRNELGYGDHPLLRTGELRDHIRWSAQGLRANVGVPHEMVSAWGARPVDIGDIAIWQEFGTKAIPARSFLGMAGFVEGRNVARHVMISVAFAIAGVRHPTLRNDL